MFTVRVLPLTKRENLSCGKSSWNSGSLIPVDLSSIRNNFLQRHVQVLSQANNVASEVWTIYTKYKSRKKYIFS